MRRESARPAIMGFLAVAVCATLAIITGKVKGFYLPNIVMILGFSLAFTVSVAVRRPLVGGGAHPLP
ncbi:DUF3159 domain-containing protein [Mycobacterium colombiense]|uniref:DUF3159 domain-containing protein n=1 Tax=Mycobacterium colombiense TaxID=339268 RepID=UPI0022ABB755|nr:DUF3159 domain-containing protein [Mycobacterium colombiense]